MPVLKCITTRTKLKHDYNEMFNVNVMVGTTVHWSTEGLPGVWRNKKCCIAFLLLLFCFVLFFPLTSFFKKMMKMMIQRENIVGNKGTRLLY